MADADVVQFKIFVPLEFSAEQRQRVGEIACANIRENAANGIGANGKPFGGKAGKYTKGYSESFNFQYAGKDDSDVNLTLTGDMLASIQVVSNRPGLVIVGYPLGSKIADQAEGNILGTYGQSSPIPGKARRFLGLPQSDLELIIEQVAGETSEETFAARTVSSVVEGILRRFR